MKNFDTIAPCAIRETISVNQQYPDHPGNANSMRAIQIKQFNFVSNNTKEISEARLTKKSDG